MAQGIYARFSPAELAKLQAKAEETGMTQSAFVRSAALQALKQGDLETRLASAIQAEARTLTDDFLTHYYDAQSKTAQALKAVLMEVIGTTKQAIAPKVDATTQIIADMHAKAKAEGRPLTQSEAAHIARLKNQSGGPFHVPGAND